MKKYITLAFLVLAMQSIGFSADDQELDSIKLAAVSAANDTTRVLLYEQLMNTQSSRIKKIDYGMKGYHLAKEIDFKRGVISCGNRLAWLLSHQNFYQAIPIYFETKQFAEEIGDNSGFFTSLTGLGYAYGKFDRQTSYVYYLKAKTLIEKEGLAENNHPISLMLGLWHKDVGTHLDSALYYLNRSYQLALNSESYLYSPNAHLRHFGAVYYQLVQKDTAMYFLRKAISSNQNRSYCYRFIAYIFRDTNELDSAIYYAHKSFELVKDSDSELQILEPATLLFELYELSNPAKALQYQKITSAAKDSIFNQEKARQIDQLDFEIQQKQADMQRKIAADQLAFKNQIKFVGLFGVILMTSFLAFILYHNNKNKQKANTQLKAQKEEIQSTLERLESTQTQLIQSEKMASLGELTAGIAHEIQNPLNFVNNFSDVSKELIGEMKEELEKGEIEEAKEIAGDIDNNLEKISHHGKRASSIVKGMLEHSRTGEGEKEPTNINELADEYLRLAYHGLRAKDKSFNADFKTDFDENLPKINVVPQDIGRVLLNLINNAFYAVSEKAACHSDPEHSEGVKSGAAITLESYKPEVEVSTHKVNDKIEISVRDNGEGIPEQVRDKIFQPFFTTKPTGSGTGLGLSLSYDIVKAHGGVLKAESDSENGTIFLIIQPARQ